MVTLEAKNISLNFDGKKVLEDVNLTIEPHETLVLIGPSGAGKTVLLKILAGIIAPSTGEVFIDGEDWQKSKTLIDMISPERWGCCFNRGLYLIL
jgi:multiple sugar transport system ATP-binding protein